MNHYCTTIAARPCYLQCTSTSICISCLRPSVFVLDYFTWDDMYTNVHLALSFTLAFLLGFHCFLWCLWSIFVKVIFLDYVVLDFLDSFCCGEMYMCFFQNAFCVTSGDAYCNKTWSVRGFSKLPKLAIMPILASEVLLSETKIPVIKCDPQWVLNLGL